MSRELIEREALRRTGAVLNERYELQRVIGSGGMGAVFEALDRTTGELVAVKLLIDVDHDTRATSRFAREARLLAALQHPHIVRVHDQGVDELGTAYLVEDLLRGRDLRSHLRAAGALSPAEARDLLLPILEALDHAHAAGVLHRDVKPENIFLDLTGDTPRPVLIDFGVARDEGADSLRSRSGAVVGTPVYMSPEQAAGRRALDARSDVWSVGVVLFECLAGTAPFTGNYHEVLSALLTLDPPPITALCPDCPAALRDAIALALQRDPDARPATALALRDLLARCEAPSHPLRRDPVDGATAALATQRSTVADVVPVAPRRRRGVYALVGVVVALLLGVSWRAATAPDAPPSPVVVREPSRPPVVAPPRPSPVVAPVVVALPVIAAAPRPRRTPVATRVTAAPHPPRVGANGAPLLEPYD